MSRKNHIKIDGMLIRTDKQFRHLKNSQKERISIANGMKMQIYLLLIDKT